MDCLHGYLRSVGLTEILKADVFTNAPPPQHAHLDHPYNRARVPQGSGPAVASGSGQTEMPRLGRHALGLPWLQNPTRGRGAGGRQRLRTPRRGRGPGGNQRRQPQKDFDSTLGYPGEGPPKQANHGGKELQKKPAASKKQVNDLQNQSNSQGKQPELSPNGASDMSDLFESLLANHSPDAMTSAYVREPEGFARVLLKAKLRLQTLQSSAIKQKGENCLAAPATRGVWGRRWKWLRTKLG